jgi:hypothetical protein
MDRRSLLAAGAAAISLFAAPTDSVLAQATPTTVDYVALTKSFFDGMINPRDFSQPGKYFAADYKSVIATDIPGPDAAAQRLKTFLEQIDGYWTAPPVWTIDETISQDTRVAVRGRLVGTRADPAKTGDLYFFGMLHFEGALISTNALLFDRSAL